jgi:hypothetical protein
MAIWRCPDCDRAFTRENQRHACGTGRRGDVLRNRSEAVVRLYAAIEAFAASLGPLELVTRDRYVLLRSMRIFADLVIMTDAVRVAIHLGRRIDDPMFIKIVSDKRHTTHVAKIRTEPELETLKPHLREAYGFSLR